jgi:PKD repeat protein
MKKQVVLIVMLATGLLWAVQGFAQAPTAAFTADKTTGEACIAVQFTDQSTPGGSPIMSWSWNFGDGTSTDPLRRFQNPCHIFENLGTYTVALTVTNCTFTGNTTDMSGGGMYDERSNSAVSSCTFVGNT